VKKAPGQDHCKVLLFFHFPLLCVAQPLAPQDSSWGFPPSQAPPSALIHPRFPLYSRVLTGGSAQGSSLGSHGLCWLPLINPGSTPRLPWALVGDPVANGDTPGGVSHGVIFAQEYHRNHWMKYKSSLPGGTEFQNRGRYYTGKGRRHPPQSLPHIPHGTTLRIVRPKNICLFQVI
jgi:hypothetical protein